MVEQWKAFALKRYQFAASFFLVALGQVGQRSTICPTPDASILQTFHTKMKIDLADIQVSDIQVLRVTSYDVIDVLLQ